MGVWDDTEKDYKARIKQYEKEKVERRREVKRQVKNAIIAGRTLPYSLDTLLDAGIGIQRIRKVWRGN